MDQAQSNQQSKATIKAQLKRCKIGWLGLQSHETAYLPKLLYADEQIHGVIYGLNKGGWAMLLATEKRVIFLDKKLLFTTRDILTYDMVSSIQSNAVGVTASVTLHTRGGDYSLRFVARGAADKFVAFIEKRRINARQHTQDQPTSFIETDQPLEAGAVLDEAASRYLAAHDTAVLSTVDTADQPGGAVVHYVFDAGALFVLTKSDTTKARNMMNNPNVALTIHPEGTMQTMQLQAIADVETRTEQQQKIFHAVMKEKHYRGDTQSAPVTMIKDGFFIVFRLQPKKVILTDYSQKK